MVLLQSFFFKKELENLFFFFWFGPMGQFSLLSAMSVCLSVSAIQNFLGFWNYPTVDQPKVDNGGVRRAGSVDRWHVTHDLWQVTRDRYRMTFFSFFLFYTTFFSIEVPKSVNKREFHSITATIERFGVSRMRDFFYNLRVVFKYTQTLILFLNFHAL